MAVDVEFLNGTNTNNINTNFQRVKEAFEKVVGREGDLPNHMNSDLDLNSNDLLNVGIIDAEDIKVDGVDLSDRLQEVVDAKDIAVAASMTATNQAGIATIQAGKAKDEADRAQNIVDNADTITFKSRAAAIAGTVSSNTIKISVRHAGRILNYIEGGSTGTALTTNSGTRYWHPDGDATVLHYGAAPTASASDNLAAFTAAISANDSVKVPRIGVYNIGGQLRITGINKFFGGDDASRRTSLNFSDTFDGPCILYEPSDPLSTSYVGNNQIANLSLVGNGSDRLNRWALDIRKQEAFRLSNVRWGGFSFGVRIAGGQMIYLDNFYGYGSGRSAGDHLEGSTHVWIGRAETSGSPQVNYNTYLSNFTIGGSSSKNIQDIITLSQTDGCVFSEGYVAFGQRSLLRLDQPNSVNVTATTFQGVYFDGVNTSTGTPHFMTARDSASAGSASMTFVGGHIGNFSDEIFSLDVGNNLRQLRFVGCPISSSGVGLGTIRGSATNGLRLQMSEVSIGGAPLGLTINGAQMVAITGIIRDVPDVSGALQLSGTIQRVRHAVDLINSPGGIVNTSTGLVQRAEYEWHETGTFTPIFRIGGTEISEASHTTQGGQFSRVGNLVSFDLAVAISSKESLTGVVSITGLPYLRAGIVIPTVQVIASNNSSLSSETVLSFGSILNATRSINLYKVSEFGTTQLADTDIQATCSLRISGSYRV